ncbi:hypothetical protein P154DRAFT_569469 [Amniculicola lignicola CBS 123094]|uniref:Uncharacterized protein n=1 Tax=Amniculicola lignicola CBS 123094 TaxID=1392246 RepID=A0A6A5X3Y1_9PLEO|nr:hypothetical protein P154DRAFT_569469 [Amniculicola lignicola CBS 123094]
MFSADVLDIDSRILLLMLENSKGKMEESKDLLYTTCENADKVCGPYVLTATSLHLTSTGEGLDIVENLLLTPAQTLINSPNEKRGRRPSITACVQRDCLIVQSSFDAEADASKSDHFGLTALNSTSMKTFGRPIQMLDDKQSNLKQLFTN